MAFKSQSRSSKMSRVDRAHFLFPITIPCGPIVYRFQHRPRYWSKIAKFIYPTSVFNACGDMLSRFNTIPDFSGLDKFNNSLSNMFLLKFCQVNFG